MDIDSLMNEIEDLLYVPNIGHSLYYKIQELKVTMSERIDIYRTATDAITPKKGSMPHDDIEGTDFELSLVGRNTWIPSLPGMPGSNGYRVVPQPVIDYIVNSECEPGIMKMQRGVRLPEISDSIFDLIFEKTGDRAICGSILTKPLDPSQYIFPDPQTENGRYHQDIDDNSDRSEVIKVLVYYLLNNDSFYRQITTDFFYRWKPVMDKKLIQSSTAE